MSADHVDRILTQWQQARPDLDCSPMGISGRIGRTSKQMMESIEQIYSQFDLSLIEMDILATLRRSATPLTPTQLYKTLMYSSGVVSTRIEGLVQRGFIDRQSSEQDRRSCQVALTDAGQAFTDQLMDQHVANLHRLVSPLTVEEQQLLASLLRKLSLSLEEADT